MPGQTDAATLTLVDLAVEDAAWPRVLPVLRELRPHLDADTFRRIYQEGHPQGLRFTAAMDTSGACVGVAGWRLVANTSSVRKLYVDDLVTTASARSSGVGARLLEELEQRARAAGCSALALDSGVQRHAAHRFYFRERMHVVGYHFIKPLA
jgi:GNAT superfamily N-acetyltransferase